MPDLQGMIDTGSNSFWSLLLAIAVVGISIFVGRWVRRKVRRVLQEIEGLDEYAGATLGRFAGWAVVLLGIVLALTVLGVDMVAISLLIVIILALVVLMGRPLIQSWGAGLLLQARAPFRPGDRIETMNYIGYVEEINARSVVMRTGDGQIVHIPNLDVVQNPLVNRTGHDGRRRSSISFGVAPATDLDAAERLLVEAAQGVSGVHDEPVPSAWVSSIGETTINLELRFWHDHAKRHQVRSAVAHAALGELNAAAVAMPFPTQELILSGSLGSSS